MINAKLFMNKINEIEKRMDYVIENWESDKRITLQEKRFVLSAYIHGLYKNKKVKDLAKNNLHGIKERRRLDFETILTAIASALIVDADFSEYWNKLKERIDRSSPTEKSNLIIQFLVILTPNTIKKINDVQYIKTLLKSLKRQDTEKKLFSYWIEKCLFSEKGQITISQKDIKYLKEYLLWELVNSEDDEHQKEEMRKKFIPEMLDYKVDSIDWIVFLIYQFLKKNKIYIITESELDRKLKKGIKSRINKKVWFPVGSSILFLILKLWKENIITLETLGQIALLMVGIALLVFEEYLPTKNIKKKKITSGLPATALIIGVLLWNFEISLMLNFIISIIGSIIIWLFTE